MVALYRSPVYHKSELETIFLNKLSFTNWPSDHQQKHCEQVYLDWTFDIIWPNIMMNKEC